MSGLCAANLTHHNSDSNEMDIYDTARRCMQRIRVPAELAEDKLLVYAKWLLPALEKREVERATGGFKSSEDITMRVWGRVAPGGSINTQMYGYRLVKPGGWSDTFLSLPSIRSPHHCVIGTATVFVEENNVWQPYEIPIKQFFDVAVDAAEITTQGQLLKDIRKLLAEGGKTVLGTSFERMVTTESQYSFANLNDPVYQSDTYRIKLAAKALPRLKTRWGRLAP